MEALFWLLVSVLLIVWMLFSKNPRQIRAIGGALFSTTILTLDAVARWWKKRSRKP